MPKCAGVPPVVLIAAVLTLLASSVAGAQDASPQNAKARVLGSLAGKLDARLIPAVKAVAAGAVNEAAAARNVTSAHGRALATPRAAGVLPIRIDAPVTEALLAQIGATGATVVHSAPRWNSVSVSATVSQVKLLTDIAGVRSVMLQSGRRLRQQGSSPNEGDVAMRADVARASFGVTGATQTVGVISDSVRDTLDVRGHASSVSGSVPNAIVSGTVPQRSGDLPASFRVVAFGPGGGTDEGAAMMEVIYDVAPGAALVFGSCGNSQTEMASNLTLLRTAGHCTVTVDDIGFFDEPFFQDGPISQAIRGNYNAGVPHFSAFGNDGSFGMLTTYDPINPAITTDDQANPPSGNCFHNWGIVTTHPSFLPIFVPAGDELMVMLQWNEPFQSYGLGSGSHADLDLYLYGSDAIGPVLASSIQSQGDVLAPSGDPSEVLSYVNNGGDKTVYLALDHFQGVRGNVMRLIFSDTVSFPAGPVNGMTAYGHATSQECIGVGAMDWYDIQHNNLAPESFSSQGGIGAGGIPYYFDVSGAPLAGAPVLRSAPALAAPDGVSTSLSYFSSFYGTSCAAPNAAAVAALVLEAAPGTSPAALISVLKSSARDAAAAPAGPGVDAFTGAGLVDANAAVSAVEVLPTITSPTTAGGNVGVLFSYTITATGSNPLTFGVANLPPGLTSNGNTIAGRPTAEGTFDTVLLSATNALATAQQVLTVTIGPPHPIRITAQAAAQPNPAPIGTAVSFGVSATNDGGPALLYAWDFGDTGTAQGNSAGHTFSAAGDFSVQVVITDGVAAPAVSTVAVTVTPLPEFSSAPTAAPNPAHVGETVSFSAAATSGVAPLTYAWDFGDGATGSGADSTHAYGSAGDCTATVVVTDSVGASVGASVAVKIVPLPAFVSGPGATPNPAHVDEAIVFSAAAKAGDSALVCSWDFGDGTTAQGDEVSHTYGTAGDYTARVSASDGVGATVTADVAITIAPVLVIVSPAGATPNPAHVGQAISFSVSAQEGNVPLTYSWDFGDGAAADGSSVTHAYVAAGTFSATVAITDVYGISSQASLTVTVEAPAAGMGSDSDGDGFSDGFEKAAGTDPLDPASTPLGGTAAGAAQPLTVSKLGIKLNFVRTGNDSVTLTGTLPIVSGFVAAGQRVTVDVGGVDAGFTLNAKGSSQRSATQSFSVRLKMQKGVVAAQQAARYSIKLSKGGFAGALAAFGLTSAPQTVAVNLPVTIVFNSTLYQTRKPLTYTSRNHKTGAAK